MASKYEEMCVIRKAIQDYADNQKLNYKLELENLKKECTSCASAITSDQNQISFDINNDNTKRSISHVQSSIYCLEDYRTKYQNALNVLSELKKAIYCYEQAFTPQNIKDGVADAEGKKGNKIYFEIRTQNQAYKTIMSEIAYELFRQNDPHIAGLGINDDAKVESLEQDYESGKITKDQLIYYTHMCWALVQNKDYLEYMSKFYPEETQEVHKK